MDLPRKLFFVGIGGIGMSGLAQFLAARGYCVAGSDRGLEDPSKAELYDALRRQGIALYCQDGSGVREFSPNAFVVSAAIESDNPDLAEAPDLPIIHRAKALASGLADLRCHRISVAGSCGKTSVTGWIAATLKALGYPIAMVNGGYVIDFKSDSLPGNFYMDDAPEFAIAEVDESDRSIREFSQETAVLLNIGNDHYEKSELEQVFSDYLKRTSGTCVISDENRELAPANFSCRYFAMPADYSSSPEGIAFHGGEFGRCHAIQSGRHSALNAMAVMQAVAAACPDRAPDEIASAIAGFKGVLQRFEIMSLNEGRAVVNDYAHNPEKLAAAINAARDRFGSPVCAIFQPHGFGPLKFMREPLVAMLKNVLRPEDKFLFLPVYYAGGTTSFSPTSDEVAADAFAMGLPVFAAPDRDAAKNMVPVDAKCILVLGARDPSLRVWAGSGFAQ